MTHRRWGFGLAGTPVLVFALAVTTNLEAQTTPSTAAYVYIQIDGPQGAVYGLRASSTGKLNAIPGGPWKPTGRIVGSTPTKFITLGADNIHSYGLTSDGAIGSQLEQNPYIDYPGGDCGSGSTELNNAVLDHTGKYVYILLQTSNGISGCSAVQSFNINSAAVFDNVGSTVLSGDYDTTLPSILGSETFAYANDSNGPIGFRRESSGALESMQFHETDPTLSGGSYTPGFPDASPTGNFVVLHLFPKDANPFQLGSYTVDSEGNLSTTNTSSNMPTSALIGANSTFSPSGKLYVLYADSGGNDEGQEVPGGIEIYNFNGAAPLTLYKKLLTGTSIDQVAWDSTNHMYAISKSANMLYVFTVTPTSVTEDTAWSIGGPVKMIVVSESTAAGSSPATQFEGPLLTMTGALGVGGQVKIDTSGDATVEVTGQAASKTYTLQFCPEFVGGNKAPACFNVTTLSTDGSGSGSSTMKFPKSGDWAGEFAVNDSSGTVLQSGLYPGLSDETYLSTLLAESTTNGGVVAINKGQDPLTVMGGSASSSYQVDETEGVFIDSSNSYAVGGFKTDAAGDGSTSIDLAKTGSQYGDMFNIEGGSSGAGYIGGFSIP